MELSLFSVAFALFLLMDPVGNIPIYLTIMSETPSRRRTFIIVREKIFALIIIILFALWGNALMEFLGIAHRTMYFAGGIVLFVMSLKMIFPEGGSLSESLSHDGDPYIFPLAVPLVAGPAVLAAVMIYATQVRSNYVLIGAVILAWFVSTIILLCGNFIQYWLGQKGIKAMERLMGLILMLIAINMFLEGWQAPLTTI